MLGSATALLARPSAARAMPALDAAWGGPVDVAVASRQAKREIRRLTARADGLLRGQGLARGTVAQRIASLFADDRYLYPDDDAGRERAVAGMNARLAALRPRLAAAFEKMAIPAAEVRRMSPADAARGRGGYREAGAYYVDLKAIRARPAWTLPSVAFHETVPGHALQTAQQAAGPAAPGVLNIYAEAWATYAEQLAAELGAYDGDPRGELGYLHWRLCRMARIVADIGLGARGWTEARAVAAMGAIQGPAIAFTTPAADVARMRQAPGIYAAQGLGALRIARLRPRRPAAWPDFHARLLTDGPWPCVMLSERVAKGSPR